MAGSIFNDFASNKPPINFASITMKSNAMETVNAMKIFRGKNKFGKIDEAKSYTRK